MPLRIFVICYGQRHAELYERIAVRSLLQPCNKAAIPGDAVVSLYSDAETMPRVVAASERIATVEPHVVTLSENHYDTQNQAFIDEIGRCVQADASIVILNPDCFWGDGSLANLLTIAGKQRVSIASPHVRVDRDKFLSRLSGDEILDNPALVSRSMECLHQSWIDADTTKAQTNSYYTGIGIRKIADGMWAVHHLLPTVFYSTLTAADYAFFKERPHARGLWDHVWPSVLVGRGRQRTLANSDAFFVAEVTAGDTHNTELAPVNPEKPDGYRGSGPHIDANRGVVGIWHC